MDIRQWQKVVVQKERLRGLVKITKEFLVILDKNLTLYIKNIFQKTSK